MNFSFIQITDHHLTPTDADLVRGFSTRYAFRSTLRHIAHNAAARADFIVSTGDLVEQASDAAYRAVLDMLRVKALPAALPGPFQITAEGLEGFPLYVLPGNHDDRSIFFERLFAVVPTPPLMNAAFTHGGVQFICLDWGPGAKGVAHPETLEFLERSLRGGQPSIILMHHQLVKIGSRWLDEFLFDDVELFWEKAAGSNVLGVFSGHVHTTYDRVVHGIPVFGLRSTAYPFVLQDEPLACLLPPHYRLITLRDGVLTTQIFEVPL
jgi:Icc protein